ncbi:MAG: hypothetical protein M1812_003501 [Candelaria pacifica]|nr:MAG: hypothetical protein M1812_003501 [Candelaria pacifica]
MGKLTDITNSANTAKHRAAHPYQRLSSSSDVVKTLTLHKEENNIKSNRMSKRESPRFMSPTVASRAQTGTPQLDNQRTTTPKLESASSAKNSNWVASTVKRVGLARADDGLSHTSKVSKELTAGNACTNKMSFPSPTSCKPDTRSKEPLAIDKPLPTEKPLPSEKPLPRAPVAQTTTDSPIKTSRSLVDARDKPLQGSPAGKSFEEEWPALVQPLQRAEQSFEMPSEGDERDAAEASANSIRGFNFQQSGSPPTSSAALISENEMLKAHIRVLAGLDRPSSKPSPRSPEQVDQRIAARHPARSESMNSSSPSGVTRRSSGVSSNEHGRPKSQRTANSGPNHSSSTQSSRPPGQTRQHSATRGPARSERKYSYDPKHSTLRSREVPSDEDGELTVQHKVFKGPGIPSLKQSTQPSAEGRQSKDTRAPARTARNYRSSPAEATIQYNREQNRRRLLARGPVSDRTLAYASQPGQNRTSEIRSRRSGGSVAKDGSSPKGVTWNDETSVQEANGERRHSVLKSSSNSLASEPEDASPNQDSPSLRGSVSGRERSHTQSDGTRKARAPAEAAAGNRREEVNRFQRHRDSIYVARRTCSNESGRSLTRAAPVIEFCSRKDSTEFVTAETSTVPSGPNKSVDYAQASPDELVAVTDAPSPSILAKFDEDDGDQRAELTAEDDLPALSGAEKSYSRRSPSPMLRGVENALIEHVDSEVDLRGRVARSEAGLGQRLGKHFSIFEDLSSAEAFVHTTPQPEPIPNISINSVTIAPSRLLANSHTLVATLSDNPSEATAMASQRVPSNFHNRSTRNLFLSAPAPSSENDGRVSRLSILSIQSWSTILSNISEETDQVNPEQLPSDQAAGDESLEHDQNSNATSLDTRDDGLDGPSSQDKGKATATATATDQDTTNDAFINHGQSTTANVAASAPITTAPIAHGRNASLKGSLYHQEDEITPVTIPSANQTRAKAVKPVSRQASLNHQYGEITPVTTSPATTQARVKAGKPVSRQVSLNHQDDKISPITSPATTQARVKVAKPVSRQASLDHQDDDITPVTVSPATQPRTQSSKSVSRQGSAAKPNKSSSSKSPELAIQKRQVTTQRPLPSPLFNSSSEYPTRNSSRRAVNDFIDPNSPAAGNDEHGFPPSSVSSNVRELRNNPEFASGSRAFNKRTTGKRNSQGTQSKTKQAMSSFRGLFHKQRADPQRSPKSTSHSAYGPTKASASRAVTPSGIPVATTFEEHPNYVDVPGMYAAAERSQSDNNAAPTAEPSHSNDDGALPATAAPTEEAQPGNAGALTSPADPTESDTARSHRLAVEIVNLAVSSPPGRRQREAAEMGRFLVAVITERREAQMALERVTAAANRAELCVARVNLEAMRAAQMIHAWRAEFLGGAS